MSAPNWLGDAQPYQNGDNAAYNNAGDPSLAFIQAPTSASFEFNQVQAQQLQHRMHNGGMLNGSPAPQNHIYQTQSTIPSKRPRPREDSMAGSPRPFSGALPGSRSQTPHGSYPGYTGAVNGTPFANNNPYQNLQQSAASTSQSPNMPTQSFNLQNAPQRVQTMSPSPFSPATQSFGNHTSPAHSENGSRVNTPQNNGPQYVPNASYGIGPGQPYMPQAGSAMSGTQPPQYGQHLQQEQILMETRMRQMGHMGQTRPGGVPQGSSMNALSQMNQTSTNQMAQIRAQQAQAQQSHQQRSIQYSQMLQNMTSFARARNLPFEQSPVILGRRLDAAQLFFGVMKMQGSNTISSKQMWPLVAGHLNYPQSQMVRAGQEIQTFWHNNLAQFEAFWVHRQQQQQHHYQRQRAMAEPSRAAAGFQPSDAPSNQPSFSPSKPTADQATRIMQPPANINAVYQTPTKLPPAPQSNSRAPLPNGYSDPQRPPYQTTPADPCSQPQSGILDLQRTENSNRPPPKNTYKDRDRSDPRYWLIGRNDNLPEMYVPSANNLEPGPKGKNENDGNGGAWVSSHGGLPIGEKDFINSVDSLLKFKLRAPLLEELGPIDVRTLILSIRSGISGEVRHALDTVASLSIVHSKTPPALDQCDDLVEALVECANDQVDLLAEHAPEVSDAMLINSYEETVRGCKVELESIQDDAKFGSLDHNLDRAVERLICITTIFRNFSFFDTSARSLTDPIVLKMMITVIRYLGTRNMLLRTHRNALDFSKDVVIFLSQTAHYLDFQTKDEALCVLHFLVSFAPLPEPNNGDYDDLSFSSYSPSLNRYLPHAVDALAKVLTREPNRSFARSIFVSDASSTPPYELLTRAFGLAISPVPELGATDPSSAINHRIPFMVQGLLAAEILINMIPSTEHNLALAWLGSQDGFASRAMRMLALLSRKLPAIPVHQANAQNQSKEPHDPYGYLMVTNRGLVVLKRLIERARDADGDARLLPSGALPNKQTVVGALSTPAMDVDVLRQLCNLYSLD